MIPILDFQERALAGPVMKATDFDIAFSKALRELVNTYEIRYDPNDIVVDDKTADAVFQAGVALLAEVGLYHLDTQRVVQLSREEILEIAREYRENPPEPVFGRGEETRGQHAVEDAVPMVDQQPRSARGCPPGRRRQHRDESRRLRRGRACVERHAHGALGDRQAVRTCLAHALPTPTSTSRKRAPLLP